MKFGMHSPSWLDAPDPAEAFEAVRAKALWAEDYGFAWFSVMDHMIQIPGVGAPDEPLLEGWTVLAGLEPPTNPGRFRCYLESNASSNARELPCHRLHFGV